MPSSPAQPWPNSYWVLPGRLLAGEYPGVIDAAATRERIERLVAAGIDRIVDLTAPDEAPPYDGLLPAGVEHRRLPIRDHAVPADPGHMTDILEAIESALRGGHGVYVHCRAGIGRTGTVVGCLLVEHGASGDAALEALNRAWQQCARAESWRSVPETESQVEYIRRWQPRVMLGSASDGAAAGGPAPTAELETGRLAAGPVTLRDRFRGALVGLAVGDALAAPTQHAEPGTFAPIADLTGGGPFELPRGGWSDDTAMALCLAESLLACGGFDARDQLERYVRWQQQGHLSATGVCAGITPRTAHALAVAQWRRQLFAGSHAPKQLDPEPLSRVAPAVMFAFASVDEAVRLAGDSARVTCQAPTVVEACHVFAAMVHAALCGAPKDEVLAPARGLAALEAPGLRPRMRSLLRGRYRNKRRAQVHTGSTVLEALEAALWVFDHADGYADGALLAANLGERSDVVGAVYGQLAGAHFGEGAIPAAWRAGLLRRDAIETLAEQL
ncbi:MAG: ADP-ribosylglycohydrolase family protein, partial [Steroidobacteraceae bacterium]